MPTNGIANAPQLFSLLLASSVALACVDGAGPSDPCEQVHITASSGPSPQLSWRPARCTVIELAVTHDSQHVEVLDWRINSPGSNWLLHCPYAPVTYGIVPADHNGEYLHCWSEAVPPRSLELGSPYRVHVTTRLRAGWDDYEQEYVYAYRVSTQRFVP